MKLRGAIFAACCALASCEAPAPPSPKPSFSAAPRDPAAVAHVGDVSILPQQIARIAAAQRVTRAEARDLAVHDALFALEARSRQLDADRDIDLRRTALLARAFIEDINTAAEARGPVTDAELDEVTARHWTELDRPEAARTTHAVVMLPKDAPPATRAKAIAIAEVIHKAIAPASEAARTSAPSADPRADDPAFPAFRTAATQVDAGDLQIRVESLPPVVADGRTLTSQATLETTFAKAAIALQRRGDVSPIVETSYGFHVVMLLERIPSQIVPREERRRVVREEVLTDRARREREKVLTELRETVKIDRSLDALLAAVPVDR